MYQLLLGVAISLCGLSTALAQLPTSSPLFCTTELNDFRTIHSNLSIDNQRDIARSRFTQIAPLADFPDFLQFNCFTDANFIGQKVRVEQTATRTTNAIYQLVSSDFGYAIITLHDDQFYVKIRDHQGRVFTISPEQKAVYAVAEWQNTVKDEGDLCHSFSQNDIIPAGNSSVKKMNSICDATTETCPAATVDVMILYTDDVRAAYGDVTTTENAIANALAEANLVLENSEVSSRFNLVYTHELSYTENNDLLQTISELQNGADGVIDHIHSLRNTYEADLVAMVVAGGGCGIGNVNTNPTQFDARLAFSVTSINCMVTNLTLPHELGHNLGLHHDWYINQSTDPCTFAHGYVNTAGQGGTSEQQWRTVMSYQQQCLDNGYFCQRLPYFSNPQVDYNNDPMGVAHHENQASDAAFVLNRSMCQVAAFKENSAAQPNLVTLANSVTLDIADQVIQLQTTIENNGLVNADATSIAFYLSENTFISPQDFLLGTATIPALASKENNPYEFVFDTKEVNIPNGTYYVGYLIDPQEVITENTETDNAYAVTHPQLVTNNIFCEGTTLLSEVTGSFTDGSLSEDYLHDSSCYWLIQPKSADCVELTFTDFDVENHYDRVNVYDGASVNATLIGSYHNGNLPTVIQSSGDALMVHFRSDESVARSGWSANYESVSCAGLPLDFIQFSAKETTAGILLNWETANETALQYFVLERSADGKKWAELKQLLPKLSRQYEWLDQEVINSNQAVNTFFYRLKIVETDGQYTYSDINKISIKRSSDTVHVFPNPVDQLLTIQTLSPAFRTLKLMNCYGNVVYQQQLKQPNNHQQISVAHLPAGIYLLTIQTINQRQQVQRIVIK